MTIKDANAGTEMFDAIGNVFDVPTVTTLPAATFPLVKIETVTLAAVFVWLAATIWSSLNTLPELTVFATNTKLEVFAGVR